MLDRSVSTANRHTVRRSSRDAVAALQGLGSRPYTRVALARPTPRSAAIDTLDAYEEARLITHWTQRGAEVCAAAALAVGAHGPAPVEVLAAAGWQIVPGGALLRRSVLTPLPTVLPWGAAWPRELGELAIVPILRVRAVAT